MLLSKKSRGRWSEDLVLKYFEKFEFELVCRNQRIAGVEIDLLFQRRKVMHLVEVKYCSWPQIDVQILSDRQLHRLHRATEQLIARGYHVRGWLAVVTANQKVHVFENFGHS
jgi:Holliday junction resolvase-like predicted endonuclease